MIKDMDAEELHKIETDIADKILEEYQKQKN